MPRPPRSIRVEAIVLKHYDYGEADRMLTLYTREKGKLRAIVKGARKVRSRKAGHLEPFTRASLLLATGRDLYIVDQAEATEVYSRLREDLTGLGYASYVAELLDKFTYDEEENSAVFRLVSETLERLNDNDEPYLAVRFYEVRLLDLLGFRPELHRCVQGREEIQAEDQYFSAAQGGVLCPLHGPGVAGAVPVSMEALRYLRHFQRSSYKDATRAKIAEGVQRELESLMQHYITYLLERGLNSPEFLRRIRQEAKDRVEG